MRHFVHTGKGILGRRRYSLSKIEPARHVPYDRLVDLCPAPVIRQQERIDDSYYIQELNKPNTLQNKLMHLATLPASEVRCSFSRRYD